MQYVVSARNSPEGTPMPPRKERRAAPVLTTAVVSIEACNKCSASIARRDADDRNKAAVIYHGGCDERDCCNAYWAEWDWPMKCVEEVVQVAFSCQEKYSSHITMLVLHLHRWSEHHIQCKRRTQASSTEKEEIGPGVVWRGTGK